MSADPGWALQQAVFAQLAADPGLTPLLTGIHDGADANPGLPYLSLGPATLSDWSSVSFVGEVHRFVLDIWSAGPGMGEAKAILAAVKSALHDQALGVAGHQLVNLRFEAAETLREIDPPLVHVQLRFRAVIV